MAGRGVGKQVCQRLWRDGVQVLSDVELVAFLLRTGRLGSNALRLSQEVLEKQGLLSLIYLDETLAEQLGEGKAARLLAAIELSRRLVRVQVSGGAWAAALDERVDALALRYAGFDQEVLGALYLDAGYRVIAERELYRGTLSRIAVEPRVIFRQALLRGTSFMLFHNHPSGDPSPSEADLRFHQRISQAGKLLGVPLLDHFILGIGCWRSLRHHRFRRIQ